MAKNKPVIDIGSYSGKQIIIHSNRLVFNSTQDDIFLTSGQYINLSAAKKVTIDVGSRDSTDKGNQFLVNAPSIQLGLVTKGRTLEPAVKGEALVNVLNDLIDALDDYSRDMYNSLPYSTAICARAALSLKLNELKVELEEPGNVKSDTVFII